MTTVQPCQHAGGIVGVLPEPPWEYLRLSEPVKPVYAASDD